MILAVTGGKGGVGKSTVSFNLAAALDGVVVDADLAMADLPHGRGPDLHDVLAGRAVPAAAVRDLGAVSVLPCGRSLAGARAADLPALTDAVAAVADRCKPVVIDCPAGLRGDAGVPLVAAEACLLVTEASQAAVADAVRVRELARVLETPLTRIVLNRAGAVETTRLANTLGAPVTPLPESPALARAQRAGVPVVQTAPESTAADRFQALAAAVQSACSA